MHWIIAILLGIWGAIPLANAEESKELALVRTTPMAVSKTRETLLEEKAQAYTDCLGALRAAELDFRLVAPELSGNKKFFLRYALLNLSMRRLLTEDRKPQYLLPDSLQEWVWVGNILGDRFQAVLKDDIDFHAMPEERLTSLFMAHKDPLHRWYTPPAKLVISPLLGARKTLSTRLTRRELGCLQGVLPFYGEYVPAQFSKIALGVLRRMPR